MISCSVKSYKVVSGGFLSSDKFFLYLNKNYTYKSYTDKLYVDKLSHNMLYKYNLISKKKKVT